MSEILDVYAAEAQARKYRDMAATEFLTSHGYKWEKHHWQAPDGLTPRQLAEQRAELLEALRQIVALPAHPMRKKGVEIAERAIANATQQRNATGGEG